MRRGLISVGLFLAFVVVFTLSRHATSPTTTTTSTTSTSTTTMSVTSTTTDSTCQGWHFSGVYNQGTGAAGTIYASITLTMNSGSPCTIEGWPLLTLQDQSGAVLGFNEVLVPSNAAAANFADPRANQAPTPLSMHVGSSVTFSLSYNDVPVGTTACESATTIGVQFRKGGSSVPVTPDYAIQPCDNGRLVVSPLY